MKIWLSVYAILFVMYGTDCSAYFSEKSSYTVPPPLTKIPMKPITNNIEVPKIDNQDQEKPTNIIKWGSFRDGRSFADVVKGVKKTDIPSDKKEKKSKKRQNKLLQSKTNFEQNEYDARRAQKSSAGEFSRRYQAAQNGGNKRRQSAHKGKLYNAR